MPSKSDGTVGPFGCFGDMLAEAADRGRAAGQQPETPLGQGSTRDEIEAVAKTLHHLYGPSEIQAWNDKSVDQESWRDDAKQVLKVARWVDDRRG